MLNITGIYFSDSYWFMRAGLEYPAVFIPAFFAIFAFGACWGSFLNVCIWRMPRRESVVNAPSHCTVCNTDIRWFDNIPVVSYLVLRGRCRVCKTPYSPRYFIVELVTGTMFCLLFLKAGLINQIPQSALFYWLGFWYILGAAWIDAKHRIIPDALTLPVAILALILSVIFPQAQGQTVWWKGVISCFISGSAVYLFLYIFSVVGRIIAKGRDAFGMGDVKLCAVLAALFGITGLFFTLFAASCFGIIYGAVIAARNKRSIGKTSVPFAPFIGAGAVLWMFAGQWIIRLLINTPQTM